MFSTTEFPTTELEFTSAMANALMGCVVMEIERRCVAGALGGEVLSLQEIKSLYTLRAAMQETFRSVQHTWYFDVTGEDKVVERNGTKFYRVPGTLRSTTKKPR